MYDLIVHIFAPPNQMPAKNNKPPTCVRQGLVARRRLCVCGGEMIHKANFNVTSGAAATTADHASQGNQWGRAKCRHNAKGHGFSRGEFAVTQCAADLCT